MISPAPRHSAELAARSPWPHGLAVLLVCATFPLIWVGALVTTEDAGMAVPDWPGTYGYNMFLYPWQTWLGGPWDLFIEHGHRLLGSLTGLITLALAAALWRWEPRNWVRWLGLAAVAGVIVQGCLGGARVLLDERLLAQLHGTLGPAFFALTAVLATVISRSWQVPPAGPLPAASLPRLAIFITLLAYLQLAVGARLRHMPLMAPPAEFQVFVVFHLLLAAVLSVHVGLAAHAVWRSGASRQLAAPAWGLAGLVLLQILLGCGAWAAQYGLPAALVGEALSARFLVQDGSVLQSSVTTLHVAVGSLIVALAAAWAMQVCRLGGGPRWFPTVGARWAEGTP